MKKLYRYPKKGYIGGVCHGMGEHTNIDPIIWRIVTVFEVILGKNRLKLFIFFQTKKSPRNTFTVT